MHGFSVREGQKRTWGSGRSTAGSAEHTFRGLGEWALEGGAGIGRQCWSSQGSQATDVAWKVHFPGPSPSVLLHTTPQRECTAHAPPWNAGPHLLPPPQLQSKKKNRCLHPSWSYHGAVLWSQKSPLVTKQGRPPMSGYTTRSSLLGRRSWVLLQVWSLAILCFQQNWKRNELSCQLTSH